MLGGIVTPADRQGEPGSHEALQNATPDPGSQTGAGKRCALSGETKEVRPGKGIGVARRNGLDTRLRGHDGGGGGRPRRWISAWRRDTSGVIPGKRSAEPGSTRLAARQSDRG